MIKDLIYDDFQEKVSNVLIRHKSILDIISKLEQSNAKINRSVIKSTTICGCISINATKQDFNKKSMVEARDSLQNHVDGELCDICKEKIEKELGNHMFYIASLCNTLNLNLYDVLLKEYKKLDALGIYSLL